MDNNSRTTKGSYVTAEFRASVLEAKKWERRFYRVIYGMGAVGVLTLTAVMILVPIVGK